MRRAPLLLALLVGMLSLYLLSSHDERVGHHIVAQVSVSVHTADTPTGSADVTDHSDAGLCALVMLAAVVIGLLLCRTRRDPAADPPAAGRALLGLLRGPPSRPSRLVLCVARI